MSKQSVVIGKLVVFVAAVGLVVSSFGPTLNYGRLAFGLSVLWVCALWLRQDLARRYGFGKGWLGWGINALLAIIPGLILLWYGWSAQAQPSLTNSGIDVCALQTGWCASGTRAFGFFGGAALLVGLVWSYFLFSIEKKSARQ